MYSKLKSLFILFLSLGVLSSCESELDLQPEDNRQVPAELLTDVEGYKQFLAKLYAGLAVSGQEGPAGDPDLVGLDEGFSQYMRLYWMLQELPTDEAVIGWNDAGLPELVTQNWTSGNPFIRTMYSRILYQVALTNEFIRQSGEGNLEANGIDESERDEILQFRAEARFLRALSYYHALDLYGNPPFITEEDPVGAFLPEQIQRAELFAYIESELLAIENEVAPARQNEYGRVDQGAVWTLLSKLYLNAEEYTGTERYSDVITYTQKIIGAGYELVDDYQKLFLADNNTNGAQNEIIFPIAFDGINTNSYGGLTFVIHASIGGDMDPEEFGVNSGWAGLRTTPEFVDLFPDGADSRDEREMFYTEGQNLEINDLTAFTDGYAVGKYKNVDVDGNQGSDSTGEHVDTDFPLFRLGDVYLMYAEAVLRGGGGSMDQALIYVNELRERAYEENVNLVPADEFNLDLILAERGRELYWEAHRRTDLIRFDQFSTNGTWAWKGNTPRGATTAAFRNLYPIPASDLGVNTNLTQNPGY
ncbi:RagB/SusD family nutrient uptake outer membrane protein [Salinimicrobium terrae]|uniref:RagB/SusD family nutrient uptake outer membrane protein n=1 Tax=Salinimicrobium terrae TaxID=470866 RepID=UPI000563E3DD